MTRMLVRGMTVAALTAALTLLAVAVVPASAATRGYSSDGTKRIVATSTRLDPADQDDSVDAYVWSDGVYTLISVGPTGGQGPFPAHPWSISADGERVLFKTAEQLVPSDKDDRADVYERHNGHTRLVTAGLADPAEFQLLSVSSDARRILFRTRTRVVPADTDDDFDIYSSSRGETTLMTPGRAGTESFDYHYVDSSGDAAVVLTETQEAAVFEDVDGGDDLYLHEAGVTRLATTGTAGPGAAAHGNQVRGDEHAVSEDGSSAVFETTAPLEAGDVDAGGWDLYQRKDGRTKLITGTEQGASIPCPYESRFYPPCYPELYGQSSDGRAVLFGTQERLTPLDLDDEWGIHLWTGPSLELVTRGSGATMSADGSRLVFRSWDRLTPDDTDDESDVYAREGGVTSLLTPSGGTFHTVEATSRGATHVVIGTRARWAPTDRDDWEDFYLSAPDGLHHISTGPTDPQGIGFPSVSFVSDDGSRVFWVTREALVPEDTDTTDDLYLWSNGANTLLETP